MRHPLLWLLRIRRSKDDHLALGGDIEETYRTSIRPQRTWLSAQVWLTRELLAALFGAMRDGSARATTRALLPPPARGRTFFRLRLLPDVRYALRRWRTPVARVLAEGSRDGGVSRLLGQRMIVVAEIALALVLLTGAHLFGETIVRLASQPLGFDPDGLLVVSTTFTGSRLGDVTKLREAQKLLQAGRLPGGGASMGDLINQSLRDTGRLRTDRVLEFLSAVPGAQAVAGATAAPFAGNPSRVPVVLEGRPLAERHEALQHSVTDRYFDAMRIPLLDGRAFGPDDAVSAGASGQGEQPVVVSGEFQRRFFPDGAVGRRFRYVYGGSYELAVHHRITGVVGDVKRRSGTQSLP